MAPTRDHLRETLTTLKNLYYLAQNLRGDGRSFIQAMESAVGTVNDSDIPKFLDDLETTEREFKELVGCILPDEEINKAVRHMTTMGEGYVSMPKWHIEKGFTHYESVFPRWPHVPLHGYVQFDSNIDNPSPYRIFLLEERIFRDVNMLWRKICELTSDGKDIRTREPNAQQDLSSYLRIITGTIFDFLEAYLNGLAFECFRTFHGKLSLPEHDLLCERDSATKKTRFVSFEKKLKDYPKILGKYLGKETNFESDADAIYLWENGKLLRDAITHPSAFINWESDEPSKFQLIAGVTKEQVGKVLVSAVNFVREVEAALGHDPQRLSLQEIKGL